MNDNEIGTFIAGCFLGAILMAFLFNRVVIQCLNKGRITFATRNGRATWVVVQEATQQDRKDQSNDH